MAQKPARSRLKLRDIENLSDTARLRSPEHTRDGSGIDRPANEHGAVRPAVPLAGDVAAEFTPEEFTIRSRMADARMAAGLSLDEVAAHLRIRRDFLEALETGHEDVLPGMTYAVGYVRTYAGFLGLDADDAVRRFKEEAAGLERRTELVFPTPAPEGKVPGLGIILASLLLVGAAYGGWYWMSERGMSVSDVVTDIPERLAVLIEGEASGPGEIAAPTPTPPPDYAQANPTSVPVTARSDPGVTARADNVAAAQTDTMPARENETPDPVPLTATAVQDNAAQDDVAPAVPRAPRLSGPIAASQAAVPGEAETPPVATVSERIVLRATGDNWVQIRAQDGTTLFTRVLRVGDVYRVPDRSGLTLATGNAGALEVIVDGREVPTLGSFGEVVRNILLDPNRLATGTAVGG